LYDAVESGKKLAEQNEQRKMKLSGKSGKSVMEMTSLRIPPSVTSVEQLDRMAIQIVKRRRKLRGAVILSANDLRSELGMRRIIDASRINFDLRSELGMRRIIDASRIKTYLIISIIIIINIVINIVINTNLPI
jgi:hypothetical protein